MSELHCEFCGKDGEKETASQVRDSIRKAQESNSNLNTKYACPTSLTWLCPDEMWICNKCLLKKIEGVAISK